MNVAIASDHGGYTLKQKVAAHLAVLGYRVEDLGTHSEASCDYPEYARQVALKVQSGAADRGVLICKSGIGMTIVANKFKGVRAALCHNLRLAKLSRLHNDANVLVLGAEDLNEAPEEIVREWLRTPFEGGRHERRVEQIKTIEREVE